MGMVKLLFVLDANVNNRNKNIEREVWRAVFVDPQFHMTI